MNIFEKLIDELKEENLLEETVIETNGNANNDNKEPLPIEEVEMKADETIFSSDEVALENELEIPDETGFEFAPSVTEEIVQPDEAEVISKPDNSKEFFYRRASEEVSSLQMVEHVLSGVERDQMKIIPKAFDDMAVKTALHKFRQVSNDESLSENSQAEFALMQETENWYSELSQRDKNITVGHLRRFCETTRPALSSQALLALARFYRNAPYSESVRSKFDLVITRLLTRETGDDKRELVFTRSEIIKHLEGLYAEWSSVSLYSPDKDDSTNLLAALKFEDFMSEIMAVENFDDLIKSDFFNRLRAVKESTSENFFAPTVTTAAIECNTNVGNRYVELLRSETVNPEILIKKYGVIREEAISDTTGKTLHLAQLLNNKQQEAEPEKQIPAKSEPEIKTKKAEPEKSEKKAKDPYAINKWLIVAAAIVIFGNVALFVFYNEPETGGQATTIVADKVNLENSVLKEHLKSARMSNGIFYGKIAPSWNDLTQEDKERFVQKIIASGNERGFTTVHLLNDDSRPVAYANGDKIQINDLSPVQ